MRRRWIRRAMAAGLVIPTALGLVACGDEDGADGGAASPQPADAGGTGGGGADDPGASADIVISGFAFDPSTIDVEPGGTITIVNEDSASHTFTADDDSFDEPVPPGEPVEVTLDGESGSEVAFHCRFHSSMTGTVTFS